ncbi:MAG: DUF6151 family protein [Burkholderiales bacterium]
MDTSHPIACRCGALRGQVHPRPAIRAVCYCRDCQAFARFLGPPPGMLDPLNGTDIVAVRPGNVAFTQGVDRLTCMSLSPAGTLRWYAACCRTPIGNTPRDRRIAHLGIVHSCLETSGVPLDTSFGPVTMHVNTASALGKAPSNAPLAYCLSGARWFGALAWARVSGASKANPFFRPGEAAPIVEPHVVTRAERDALRGGA